MNKLWKYIALCAVAVGLVPAAACSDDEEVDPYTINYAYLYEPNNTFATIEFKANGEFLNIEDPMEVVPVRLTKPAPADITVEVAVDPTLVDEYNANSDKQYTLLQGAEVVNPQLTVKKGEYLSTENIKLGFGDHSGVINGGQNMIVPLVIRQVSGGVTLSKTSRVFLTFNSDYKANKVNTTADIRIKVDIEENGWQSKYTTLTIPGFINAEWAADAPITMNVAIDPALIDEYNATYGTAYQPLSATTAPTVTIAQGEQGVDLSVTLGDYTQVTSGVKYMVPLKLSDFNGDGAMFNGSDVVYVTIYYAKSYTCSNVNPTGKTRLEAKDTWSLTYTRNGADRDYTYLLASGNTRYGSVYASDKLLVDFGEPTTLSHLLINPWSAYYAFASFSDLETSADGVNWMSYDYDGNQFPKSSAQYFNFGNSITVRYIRMTIGSTYSYYCYLKSVGFYN